MFDLRVSRSAARELGLSAWRQARAPTEQEIEYAMFNAVAFRALEHVEAAGVTDPLAALAPGPRVWAAVTIVDGAVGNGGCSKRMPT